MRCLRNRFVELTRIVVWICCVDPPTLLVVSGGVDSVVVRHLFQQAHLPFAIAHCNFNLLGAVAAAEAHIVAELSKSYEVSCYSTIFVTKAFAKTYI